MTINVLKNSIRISDITKRDNFQFNFPQSSEKKEKNAFVQTLAVSGTLKRVDSRGDF